MLKFILHFFVLMAIAAAVNYFDHWQCHELSNATLYDVVDERSKEAFNVIEDSRFKTVGYYYISCFQCGLEAIPQTLNPKVEILNLNENSITYLGGNSFNVYNCLRAIVLQSNCAPNGLHFIMTAPCRSTSLIIDKNAFSGLNNLIYLDLSGNSIEFFPENLPPSLIALGLFYTSLGPINTSQVQQLQSLQIMLLSSNCVDGDLVNLCRRNFSVANLTFFSQNLTYMTLAHNNLRHVPTHLLTSSLTALDLGGNNFVRVEKDDFDNCPNLTVLHLSFQSRFTYIPLNISKFALQKLTQLKTLDLSGNMLKSLPDLSKNINLESLNLELNCFGTWVTDPYLKDTKLPHLTYINLAANTFCGRVHYPLWITLPKLRIGSSFSNQFPNLKVLILGNFAKGVWQLRDYYIYYGLNFRIIDDQSLKNLSKLESLKSLHLAACGVHELSADAFHGLNITHVDMRVNQIGEGFQEKQNMILGKNIELSRTMPQNGYQYSALKSSYPSNLNTSLIFDRNSISNLSKLPLKYFPDTIILSLRDNRISYVNKKSFSTLLRLEILDLSYNPIRKIDYSAFSNHRSLQKLSLNFTSYQQEFTFSFLFLINSTLTLNFGDITDNIYRVLDVYRQNNTKFECMISIDFAYFAIPDYLLSSDDTIFAPFSNLKHIRLRGAHIKFTLGKNIFKGVEQVENLTLTDCNLQSFPAQALSHLKNLRHLDLSFNKIEILDSSLVANLSKKLKVLNLTHNFISNVSEVFDSLVANGLEVLDLSHNNIYDVGPSVISLAALKKLSWLDLRGNSIECYCDLSRTFGSIIHSKILNITLPGFVPLCSDVLNNYYGGCLTCQSQNFLQPSLFTYSVSYVCEERFVTLLTVSYLCAVVCFIFFSWFCLSKYMKKLAMLCFTHNRLMPNFHDLGIPGAPEIPTYAFDGFVYYDKEDETIANWVDFVMVPNLEQGVPKFKICVMGRDDWCGATQVEQILLRIEASRKTIVLLSGRFFKSTQCKYVLGVLEELLYTKGIDKSILITFASDPLDTGLFRSRHKRKPGSVLNYAASLNEENSILMFWELLRHSMMITTYL